MIGGACDSKSFTMLYILQYSCPLALIIQCEYSVGLDEGSSAPSQRGLARDKPRDECAVSAVRVPGIEVTVQKNATIRL